MSSNLHKAMEDLGSDLESEALDLAKKEREVYENRINKQYEDLKKSKDELEKNKSIDLSQMPEERIKKLQEDTEEYLKQAKTAKVFLNEDFNGKIPYFGRNLILIGATTGDGKSTITSNLTLDMIKQGGRVLIITNEEKADDCYNRITALIKGWPYNDHKDFTDEQRATFKEYIGILAKRVYVVEDDHNGVSGQTTSLEGVTDIVDKAIQCDYDLIIIDYYQGIAHSKDNPMLVDWQVQERLADKLDLSKNKSKAPIVLMSQLSTNDEKTSFKQAIEGRKKILNKATCAMRVLADRENLRTAFEIKKSRFNAAVGSSIYVGFDKGRYVPYTPEWANQVEITKARKEQSDSLKSIFDREKNEES